MTSTKTRLLLEEEAARLEKHFSATGDKRFLDAARLLKQGMRRRGRPAQDDDPLLYRMARLLRDRKAKTPWAAATRVAKEAGGHSLNATAMRLNRKFKESGEFYSWTLQTYEFQRYMNGVRRTWEPMIEQLARARARTLPALQQLANFQAKMQEQLRRSGILAIQERLEAIRTSVHPVLQQLEEHRARSEALLGLSRFMESSNRRAQELARLADSPLTQFIKRIERDSPLTKFPRLKSNAPRA